jgi:hypothetical protein
LRASHAPRDAEFLLLWSPRWGTSTDRTTAGSAAEEHLRGVDVGVVPVPAGHALKLRLRPSASLVDRTALRAGLRGVRCRDLLQTSSEPRQLVREELYQDSPTYSQDPTVEPGLLPHPPPGLPCCSSLQRRQLPGLLLSKVGVWQHATAGVSQHVCNATVQRDQRLQSGLVKAGVKAARLPRAGEPHQALLVRDVPKCAQSPFPAAKPKFLRLREVDAVAEGLANQHGPNVVSCRGENKGAARHRAVISARKSQTSLLPAFYGVPASTELR